MRAVKEMNTRDGEDLDAWEAGFSKHDPQTSSTTSLLEMQARPYPSPPKAGGLAFYSKIPMGFMYKLNFEKHCLRQHEPGRLLRGGGI